MKTDEQQLNKKMAIKKTDTESLSVLIKRGILTV